MRFLLILIFFCKVGAAQISLDSSFFDKGECLIKSDFLSFNLVDIKQDVYNSIDTIISKDTTNSFLLFWYIEVNKISSRNMFVLSKDHIEQFIFLNKTKGLTNKVCIIKDRIVLVRDESSLLIKMNYDIRFLIKNKKELDAVYFNDYPFWEFLVLEDKILKLRVPHAERCE